MTSPAEQQELSFRKIVLTSVEAMIDVEDPSEFQAHLEILHTISWDEVIEERFVNKQCGYPTCSGLPPLKKKTQMYQIDKKEGKIYETCKQRSKFCSERCYHKSFFIRNQLEEQPLWITGINDGRRKKRYDIPDENFICPVTEKEDEITDKEPSVEFVADSIIAKMKNMKLNEDAEEVVKPRVEDPEESAEQYKLTEDDKDFIRSIRQFKNNNFAVPTAPIRAAPQPKKVAKVVLSEKDKKKEEEILAKLREKYGGFNAKQKKKPIMIEPKFLTTNSPVEVKETKKVQWASQKPSISWLVELVKGWFTEETRRMIHEGARPSGGTAEQILMDFLSGKKTIEIEGVNLPNLDKYNVREKRLHIILQGIRSHWLDLEAHLHLTPTRRDLLSRVVATFHLDSENITGWNKKELNSIVCALFIVICLIDLELGDEYFNKDHVSSELSKVAEDICGMTAEDLVMLYNVIKNEISC